MSTHHEKIASFATQQQVLELVSGFQSPASVFKADKKCRTSCWDKPGLPLSKVIYLKLTNKEISNILKSEQRRPTIHQSLIHYENTILVTGDLKSFCMKIVQVTLWSSSAWLAIAPNPWSGSEPRLRWPHIMMCQPDGLGFRYRNLPERVLSWLVVGPPL